MSLTLEQVLARSMRASSRKRPQLNSIFSAGSGSAFAQASSSTVPHIFGRQDEDHEPRKQGEYLRPAVSGLLVKNSQDLLMTLQTAKLMSDWVNALETYEQAVRLVQLTPNVAHLHSVADTLLQAQQFAVLESFADQIVATLPASDAKNLVEHVVEQYSRSRGWEAALQFVERHRNFVSAGAFASCVRACERDLEWLRALEIVGSMRGSVLNDSDERAQEKFGPVPDAVTYASLINVLEQSGKNAMASELLSKLPGPEKEAITASYAALVHVWAERLSRRKRW